MEVDLKGLYKRPIRNAAGDIKIYYYAWRGGPRLNSEPGTIEFVNEFQEHQKRRFAKPKDTISGLILEYKQSPDYRKLAAITKRDHEAMFERIVMLCGDMPVDALEDRKVRG